MFPRLHIVDNALSSEFAAEWRLRMLTCLEQSTPCSEDELLVFPAGQALVARAITIVGDLTLIHAPHFALRAGHETEMHRDVGEYAVCYYPYDCPTGPLRTEDMDVEVRANRLVAFDATHLTHMQVVPTDGSTRYSVALKFRRPVA